ncbi:MAG: hypothetical protein AVDCRST_MAG18-4680, partial [uncultured Thermomicrobiales bacterium]
GRWGDHRAGRSRDRPGPAPRYRLGSHRGDHRHHQFGRRHRGG